jgi:hypothetical protein
LTVEEVEGGEGWPAGQRLYTPLRGTDEAERVWRVSEQLTGTAFPAA